MKYSSYNSNPYMGIAAVIGGLTLIMIALIVLFVPDSSWIIVPVVIFMALLGMSLGKFASKK